MQTSPLIFQSSRKTALHIVLAKIVADSLLESNVPGDILIWFDQLTTGPTPHQSSLEEMSKVRTRYLRSAFQWPYIADTSWQAPDLKERDQVLMGCADWEEVVLWFGPTVIEQFSMMQILAALSKQKTGSTRLSLVSCPRDLMAVYRPEELATFFDARTTINRSQIKFAEKAWSLYCAPDPMPLFRFATRNLKSRPIICIAILWQFLRYPAVGSGLSILECMLLNQITTYDSVRHAVGITAADDHAVLMWDVEEIYQMMWDFMHLPTPLIEKQSRKERVRSRKGFNKLIVGLTAFGREVLEGAADNVAVNGINRWIGGVHLKGNTVRWRWNAKRCV